MNAASLTAAKPRAERYVAATFTAFRLPPGGFEPRAYPLDIAGADSLEAAVAAAQVACIHKEHLAIRVEDERGARVHVYAIKRKARPSYVYKDYETKRVHDLYAEAVCVVPGEVWS